MNLIELLQDCKDRLAYLEPDQFDDADHKQNWDSFLATLSEAIENPSCLLYCVEREGGDGIEHDVFFSETLADEWAETCNGRRYNEYTIDRNTLNEMKDGYEATL